MPKLLGNQNQNAHIASSGHAYSAVGIERVTNMSNTLVGIAIDETGSMTGWTNQVEDAIKQVFESCAKSPESQSLLVRTTGYNSSHGVRELHGFVPLVDVDASSFTGDLRANGLTNTIDATIDLIETTLAFGKQLVDQGYQANAILFVITDGDDNTSKAHAYDIKKTIQKVAGAEILDSIRVILIGINDKQYGSKLSALQSEGGFDEYISIGDATPGKLAKLAQWVSKSVSTTSQVCGTGGPSQSIQLTF